MSTRTVIQDPIPERSSARLTAQLVDENGSGISPSTLTLSLYVLGDTNTIINNRNNQNVLNTNDVTVDTSGNLTWNMQPQDNQIMSSNRRLEYHVALFEWTWGTGKAGKHEIVFPVENLQKIT